MHGSRSKIPSKKSRQAALRGVFNSGVKGVIIFKNIRYLFTLLRSEICVFILFISLHEF
jgi:hypothetical protein